MLGRKSIRVVTADAYYFPAVCFDGRHDGTRRLVYTKRWKMGFSQHKAAKQWEVTFCVVTESLSWYLRQVDVAMSDAPRARVKLLAVKNE